LRFLPCALEQREMHPLILLSGAGFLLALNINLSKIATAAGVNAIESAFWSTAGAGVVLAFASLACGNKPFSLRLQLFGLAAGTVSYAIPTAIVFLSRDTSVPRMHPHCIRSCRH